MVIAKRCSTAWKQAGSLIAEIVVAMGILAAVVLPVSYSFVSEQQVCRGYYYRAIAMEIVDGEMEILRAGEWKAVPEGTHSVKVVAHAATNLPPGRFELTRKEQHIRLEWLPENQRKWNGGKVRRECHVD